jgi:glutamate/tyrosine decarboxylase-like PLP-dependent enzyme
MKELLADFLDHALLYIDSLDSRRVAPPVEAVERLALLDEPLPEHPTDPRIVLRMIDEIGSPATVATAGGRYFGFVTGGALPAALAANLMAGVWDQNAGYRVQSPVAARIEDVCLKWLREVLGLPAGAGGGFVTGATMANFAALAAARRAVLLKAGWNVEEDGLIGAPPVRVVVGDEVHVSVLKALSLLGLGRARVERAPVDAQGRMRVDALPNLSGANIVCIQAGNVNTGAFDPAKEICAAARDAGAWVHVDGAFGLWAAASPRLAHLSAGFADADSWATDAHKWLNAPYDSGIAFVREAEHLRAAMTVGAAYLIAGAEREPCQYTPDMSRRARGLEIWAALRSLGREGLADMIERCCRHAARFTEGLRAAGYEILNDVVLNQVLVSFGDDATTRRVIEAIQTDGTCWCGGTVWQGRAAMRISVSSWATTEDDVERSLNAIIRIASMHR